MFSPGKNYSGRMVTEDKVAFCNCELQCLLWGVGSVGIHWDLLINSGDGLRKAGFLSSAKRMEKDLVTSLSVLTLPLEHCVSFVRETTFVL